MDNDFVVFLFLQQNQIKKEERSHGKNGFYL